jgi:hypothetical protein
MFDSTKIANDLGTLESGVTLSRLPETLMNFRECYRLQIKSLGQRFSQESEVDAKMLYFSAAYQLTRMHQRIMEQEVSKVHSRYSYLTSLINASPEETYLKTLDQFLKKYADHNEEFCRSEVADAFIVKKGVGEALTYELGLALTNENRDPSLTMDQLVRRLFVLNYFQSLIASLNSKITNINLGSGALNALLFIINPPLAVVSSFITVAALPSIKEDTKSTQRSLHRITFETLMPDWRVEAEKILTDLSAAKAAFDLLPEKAKKSQNHANIV